MRKYKNITLREICEFEKLSGRSFKVCLKSKLITLEDVLKYYQIHKNFKRLSQIGNKSNQELITLCQKYINKDAASPEEIKQKLARETEKQLVLVSQNKLIDCYIQLVIMPLTTETRKILNSFKLNSHTLQFAPALIVNYDLKHLPPGKARIVKQELKRAADRYRSFIHFIKRTGVDEFQLGYLIEIIRIYHPLDDNMLLTIMKVAIFSDKISLFRFIAILTTSNGFFRPNELAIFDHLFHVNGKSQEECLKRLSIKPATFRKIVKILLTRIPAVFRFLDYCDLSQFTIHHIDQTTPLIVFNDKFTQESNRRFAIKFNTRFYFSIISSLLSSTHTPIAWGVEYNNTPVNNYYIIDTELDDVFNFYGYLEFMHKEYNRIRFTEEIINIETTMVKFFFGDKPQRYVDIKQVCKLILYYEFNLVYSATEDYILPVNTVNSADEIVYKALDEIGKMSTPITITAHIRVHYPNIKLTSNQVLQILNKHSEVFFHQSTPHHYGILTWDRKKCLVINPRGGRKH